MFTFTVVTSIVVLLCTGIGPVDARTISVRAPLLDDAIIKRSTIVQRDVVNPPITFPTTGTQWVSGSHETVTWDTSVIPPGFQSTGMIVLGYLDDSDPNNEHLDLNDPLATGFSITAGQVGITVPSVPTRDTYILVLFGDSGNASGKFTIKGLSIGSPSSSSASASAPSATDGSSNGSSDGTAGPTATSAPDGAAPSATPDGSSDSPGNAAPSAVPNGSSNPPGGAASLATPLPNTSVAPSPSPAGSTAPSATSPVKNAGHRSVSSGDSAMYMSVVCMLGVLLGLTL